MIEIDEKLFLELIDFIELRPTVPEEIEINIVNKHKDILRKQLIGKKIKLKAIPILKSILCSKYYQSLVQPGEAVGIVCGQSVGEKTTQSSLNNFHSAGLDTGSTSQIDNLHNIINASKIKKKENKKLKTMKLYLKEKPTSLEDLKLKTSHYLEAIKFSDLLICEDIKTCDYIPEDYFLFYNFDKDYIEKKTIVKVCLKLEIIYNYKISIDDLKKSLKNYDFYILPFSLLEENSTFVEAYFLIDVPFFEFYKNVKIEIIVGLEEIKSHIFTKDNFTNEWYIECLCSNMNLLSLYEIYDLNRVVSDSINDINSYFGILVTKELILQKCKEIITGIDDSHFKILSMRMTKNGVVEPLTRYTMRSTNSPLTKASFEESFETLIKACKFNEKEIFNSVSSSIICGKKPRIGTYQCEVLIDPSFYSI